MHSYIATKGIASYYYAHTQQLLQHSISNITVHVKVVFMCDSAFIRSDLKCIEYNNFYNICRWINFVTLDLWWKFNHIKNKHMKYSCDLIWYVIINVTGMFICL